MGVDLRDVRIKRLELFAQRHGAEDNPSKLGLLIGKKPNQVYNLLHRHASFGEKVARSIEEAAGLPRYWLDTEDVVSPSGVSPDVLEIAIDIDSLPAGKPRDWVLMTVREAVKLAREMATEKALGPPTAQPSEANVPHSSQRRRSA